MKLLFANLSSLTFDVMTPGREPLGGSESCLCYLARQLAANGHDITLAARLPDGTADRVANIRHRPIGVILEKAFFDAEKFDAIITVNAAIACPRFREYSASSLNILWDHLPPDQEAVKPLANPFVHETIGYIAYVSAWQKTETEKTFSLTTPGHVIANGVTPSFENMFASAGELLAAKQNRAAYTSVPDRGLAELLEAIPDDTPLDVFSSKRVYQSSDEAYADVFRRARENAHVSCHGSVSQNELAARLRPAAFLAYPCITPETFCLAALEGLAAGMKVIATDIGGIAATTMGYADLLPVNAKDSRQQFISRYRQLLEKNIAAFKTSPEIWAERMFAQVQAVNRQCTWALRAKEWEAFLATALRDKSAVETRQSSV